MIRLCLSMVDKSWSFRISDGGCFDMFTPSGLQLYAQRHALFTNALPFSSKMVGYAAIVLQ